METSVKQRLTYFLRSINMTQKAFEISIEASNGYVNNISKGIGTEKLSVIKKKYPQLNIEWLMTGEGEMLNDTQAATATPADTDRLLAMLEEDHRLLREQLGRKDETIDRLLSIMEADRNIERKKETA